MGVIAERISVNIVDKGQSISSPTLAKVGLLGTTAGKSDKDRLLSFASESGAASSFDAGDTEFGMIQTILSQGVHTAPPRQVHVWNITRTDYRLATVDIGSVGNQNALSVTADKYGDWGNRLSFMLLDGPESGAAQVAFVQRTLATGSVGGDTGITWTQTTADTDIVRVKVVDPQAPSKLFNIKVLNTVGLEPEDKYEYLTLQGFNDYTIEVSLATDSQEAITSTATDVINALTNSGDPNYHAFAATLVDVANTGASDGSGTMAAVSSTPIPIKTAITVKTDATGASGSRAWELRDFMNQDSVLAPLYFVADTGASNGTGLVAVTGTNEQYTLDLGAQTSGDFTLTFDGQTTAVIAHDATIAAVKTAIENLSTVGTGNVEVSGDGDLPSNALTITFVNALGGQDLTDLTATFTNLETPLNASLTKVQDGATSWTDLDRISNATESPLELARAMTAVREYSRQNKLEFPYWWCTTSREEVAGDGQELVDFASATSVKSGDAMQFVLTNKQDETPTAFAARRDAYASDRVTLAAHRLNSENIDAAMVGMLGGQAQAFVEGSREPWTAMYKTLNTVSASNWSTTARNLMWGTQDTIVTYEEDMENVFVTGSRTTSSEFIDRRWKKDWITLQLMLAIFNLMKQGPPAYDNEGIGIIEGVVRRKMDQFVEERLIGAWDDRREFGIYRLNFPRIDQVDEVDFNNRLYKASALYQDAGVIEQVDLILTAGFFAPQGLGNPNIS